MTDRPIIFSAPMVRALLAGRKTQTRRIAYRPWIAAPDMDSETQEHFDVLGHIFDVDDAGNVRAHAAPTPWRRTKPGDRLWVRENFATGFDLDDDDMPMGEEPKLFFSATYDGMRWLDRDTDEWRDEPKWTPSIHMPRWASRLTLVVTDVRVQRLHEISVEDVYAEGVLTIARFAELWDALHGPGSWDANPWVVAITFNARRCNIDAMETAS